MASLPRRWTFRTALRSLRWIPFHGSKNAIDDQLEDTVALHAAFHVVKLATATVDEARRRVQREIHGQRGRI